MSDAARIDADRAVELLEEAVQTRGEDFVYQQRRVASTDPYGGLGAVWLWKCRYVWDGKCDCLIGVALNLGGVPIDVLADLEGAVPGEIKAKHPHMLTYHAADVFTAAQEAQDQHHTWGMALDAARQRRIELGEE